MAFVLATGDTEGNFSPKLRDFLGTDWAGPTSSNSGIEYDGAIPRLAFAAQELEGAFKEAGRENLVVYRGTPEHPEVALWKSKEMTESGPYQLGITAAKRLVVFRYEGKKIEIFWRNPEFN